MKKPWKQWMLSSLLVGLSAALLWGMVSLQRQQALADDVIRLHIIAASDRGEDQALKLQVRDAVLAQASDWLTGTEDRGSAETILRAHLSEIDDIAAHTLRAAGCNDNVKTLLSPEVYPTRDYGTFALPGGEYLSLRVVIGEGAGHNWWCVVFPPLCTATVTEEVAETAADAGLTQEDIGLITRSDENYVIKFKSIELWEKWCSHWR